MVLLGYLAIGFTLWMIVDAVRRRVRPGTPARSDVDPSLDDLRRVEGESPSFHNRLRLAWALSAAGLHAEAAGFFEKCVHTHPQDRDARYGLGVARLDAGDRAAGIEALSALVQRTIGYDDYGAATRLVEALFEDGRRDEAFALLDGVARHGRKLEHQVALARYQMRADLRADARATLVRALASFEAQPDDVRPRSGAVATEARRLLRTLDGEPG